MKKIYALFVMMCVVLGAIANPIYCVDKKFVAAQKAETINPAKVAKAEKVTKQVSQEASRQAIAKKMQDAPVVNLNGVREYKATKVMNFEKQKLSNTAKKVAAKRTDDATAPDTVVIPADQFFYKYYAETYDWFIAIADADMTYVINLDYYSDDFAGTFTEADLDMYYSYIQYFDEEGYTNYIDIEEATFVVTDDENGKSADVTILGSDGKVYVSYAYEAPIPEAKGEKTLAYTTAELLDFTASSGMWQFWAEENGWYTSIVMVAEQVEGEYTRMDMVDQYYNYIAYFTETDTTIIDMLDINATVTREGKTWTLVADALGTDTIMYHITMSYTKPDPVDTVSIVATDLYIDEYEFWGYVFTSAEASNDEYRVYLSVNNQYLTAGEYTSGDFSLASCEITDKVAKEEIGLTEVNVIVAGEGNARTIVGEVVGDNNVLYQLDLSYVVPEVADTVKVVFDTPGVAEWYDADSDYFIYNENDEYFVYLDMITEKDNFVGEFTAEDFLLNYTAMGEIVDGDTTTILAADAKAVVTAVSESLVHIEAEITGKNGTLYLVSTDVQLPGNVLKYDTEEPAVNRTYTDEADEVVITTDYVEQYGMLYVELNGANNSDYTQLLFYVEKTAEGTVVPVGTYTIDDSGDYGTVSASTGYTSQMTPSFYSTIVEQDGKLYYDDLYFMVGGTVKVESVEGRLKLTVDAVNSYGTSVKIAYEASKVSDDKPHLQLDAQSGAVDKTFTVDDQSLLTEKSGYFTYQVTDGKNMLALLIVADKDENTVIPVGTYEINGTQQTGTVLASTGLTSTNSVTYSFYSTVNAQGQLTTPIYFLVGGNVEVSVEGDKLKMEVNAVNSYDVPVHVVCEYQLEVAEEGLPYDEKEGVVNVVYTNEDEIYYTLDFIPEWGELYIDLMAADGSDMTTLTFMVEAADAETKVPVGVYPLSDSYEVGTAMSGMWVEDPTYGGYAMGCYYSTLDSEMNIEKLWYMVEGTVTVKKNADASIAIIAEATNSYGVPVKVTYNAKEATALDNIKIEKTARKVLKNNQLFLVKDGVRYNVLGSVVK